MKHLSKKQYCPPHLGTQAFALYQSQLPCSGGRYQLMLRTRARISQQVFDYLQN